MAKPVTQNSINKSARISARESREVKRLASRLDGRYEKQPIVQSAITAGRNQVQIGGNYYPAEGVEGQGAAVAVVNVGSPAVARYAPSNTRSVVSVGGTGRAGGGGGGSGPTYVAGDAITIDGSYTISVKLNASGAIIVGGGGGLTVNVGDGIQIDTNALTLRFATDPGLEIDSNAVRVKAYHGITRDSNGVSVKVNATASGLEVGASGLAVADSIAGAGLGIAAKVLAVNVGDGLDIVADAVAVDVTDIIDTAYGLTESSNNIRINKATDSGLTFNGGGQLTLGTPSNISLASVNSLTGMGVSHAHYIVTSSDVGTTPAAAILASNASGQLTLAQLTLRGNLVFAGGDRSITASNKLTVAPTGDLLLDPTGLVLLPNAQEMRTETFSDLVTGISGLRLWDRGSNYRQMTIGAIKADEMFVRVFVADEVRIDRGEEYWSKSYGVIETDFTMPADEATVDVWFENAPALAAANLFSVNDWLLARTIDWGTGLVIQKIWFQVVSLLVAGSVDGYRQQWRIRRKSGGTTGQVVKKGNTFLDAGQVGQGWIHLSALDQDGGPFIQIGEYTSVAGDVPQFTNYVRIGNLNGVVDYATDTWGQAAGDDLGTTPSAGFSGYAVDATDGLRLFNTSISMYDSGTRVVNFNKDDGLNLDMDVSEGATWGRYIRWHPDVDSMDITNSVSMGAYKDGSDNVLYLRNTGLSGTTPKIYARAIATSGLFSDLTLTPGKIQYQAASGAGGYFRMEYNVGDARGRTLVSAQGSIITASTLHVYENSTATTSAAGVTVEQAGTGDAVLQYLLTGGTRWMTGIDNSDSDTFKISPSTNLGASPALTITTGGFLGVNQASPQWPVHITGTNAGAKLVALTLHNDSNTNDSEAAIRFVNRSTSVTSEAFRVGEISVDANSGSADFVFRLSDGSTLAEAMRLYSGGNLAISGKFFAPATFYQNDTATTSAAGVTVEQAGTGDAVLQYLLTGGTRWMTGIDNSDSDTFKIAPGSDLSSYVLRLTNSATLTLASTTSLQIAAYWPSALGVPTGSFIAATGHMTLAPSSVAGNTLALMAYTGSTYHSLVEMTSVGSGEPNLILTREGGLIGVAGVTSPGAQIDVQSESGTSPIIRSNNYGTSRYHFLGRSAAGTSASPTQAVNGTNLMSLGGLGYTSSGWSSQASVEISFQATQSYTSTAQGGKLLIYVTKNGTLTRSIALDIGNDREFYAPGVYAHTTASAANVNVDADGWLRRSTSSARYKTDIRPMPSQSVLLDQLAPVLYKPVDGVGGGNRDYPGLIAESVVRAGGSDYVTFDDAGRPEYVMYDRLVVLTIAEIQQLKGRIAELERKLA